MRQRLSGSIGIAILMKPYVPSFSNTAASITDPDCRSLSVRQEAMYERETLGLLTPNPTNIPANIQSWAVRLIPRVAAPSDRATIEKVCAWSPTIVPSARSRELGSLQASRRNQTWCIGRTSKMRSVYRRRPILRS